MTKRLEKKLASTIGIMPHTAWKTSEFFTVWTKDLDSVCGEKGRKISLFLDNFAGNTYQGTLTYITDEKYESNMPSHVQLMNTDIIACFKVVLKSIL